MDFSLPLIFLLLSRFSDRGQQWHTHTHIHYDTPRTQTHKVTHPTHTHTSQPRYEFTYSRRIMTCLAPLETARERERERENRFGNEETPTNQYYIGWTYSYFCQNSAPKRNSNLAGFSYFLGFFLQRINSL